jgi:undecaprenyl-diphosphatase
MAIVTKRRLLLLLLLVLIVTAFIVTEDVLSGKSAANDEMALRYIHAKSRMEFERFFEVATVTGSSSVLFPLCCVIVIALWAAGRKFEAVLIAASATSGAAMVYLLKAIVGRVRPALWETEWYWGSSFPSGHTLVVAAFAIALALGAARIWPGSRVIAIALALLWVFVVAVSRLVLGVHWPTDVIAAACMGAVVPLVMTMAYEWKFERRR